MPPRKIRASSPRAELVCGGNLCVFVTEGLFSHGHRERQALAGSAVKIHLRIVTHNDHVEPLHDFGIIVRQLQRLVACEETTGLVLLPDRVRSEKTDARHGLKVTAVIDTATMDDVNVAYDDCAALPSADHFAIVVIAVENERGPVNIDCVVHVY